MLKKMRQRFVLAAMSAITAVMSVLVLGINFWNYSVTIERMNQTILQLMDKEPPGMEAGAPGRKGKPPGDFFGGPSPEAPYMTRYFSVYVHSDGTIADISRDFISSISEQEAEEYAAAALKKGKPSGFCKEYRFVEVKDADGTHLFFLNVSKEQQFMKILLFISCLVAFLSIIVVFFLVVVFSGRAIRPYMENMERQKKFITDASHEIKTPLTSIGASAEALSMEIGENEWVANIKSQTGRLSKLVADLVTLSRLDEETPFFEKDRFSFSEAAWEVAESFRFLARAKQKNFSCQIEEDLDFYGDQASIQKMLSVLLDNALKYSCENGRIRLKIFKKHKHIVTEVWNDCESLEMDDPNRLFDRFYRPDPSRAYGTGGYGIGLSIAKAIAEAHHGRISVKFCKGEGIQFRIVL